GAFTVHLLEYNAISRQVRVRVRRGTGVAPPVVMNSGVTTLNSQRVGDGVTTWEQGEALCLSGTWSYVKLAHSQEAVIDATYELGAQGMEAQWSIEGIALPRTSVALSGVRTVKVTVRVADPKFKKIDK